MAMNTNNTDVMRETGQNFYQNSLRFLEEHDNIQQSLNAISEALGTFQSRFAVHDKNVAEFQKNLTAASAQLEAVWESTAADAFEETFAQFNRSMQELSDTLQAISARGADLNEQIAAVVDVIKQNVQDMAEVCDTTCDNFEAYAEIEDLNERKLAHAFGH